MIDIVKMGVCFKQDINGDVYKNENKSDLRDRNFSDKHVNSSGKLVKSTSVSNEMSGSVTISPINISFGTKSTNIVEHHSQKIQGVADETNTIIGIRPVEDAAIRLIRQGSATKDMFIKGKSSDFGPMSGMIPKNQSLSKLAGKDMDISKKQLQIKWGNEQIQQSVGDPSLNISSMVLVLTKDDLKNLDLKWDIGNSSETLNNIKAKDASGNTHYFSAEKVSYSSTKYEISYHGLNNDSTSELVEVLCPAKLGLVLESSDLILRKNKGQIQNFKTYDNGVITFKQNDITYSAVKITEKNDGPTIGKKAFSLERYQIRKHKECEPEVAKLEAETGNGELVPIIGEGKPYTADFDLAFCAVPLNRFTSGKHGFIADMAPVHVKRDRLDAVKSSLNKYHGNISRDISYNILPRLNLAISGGHIESNTTSVRTAKLFHHGSDQANPYADPSSNYPMTVWCPTSSGISESLGGSKGESIVINNTEGFKEFSQVVKDSGFNLPMNPLWEKNVIDMRRKSYDDARTKLEIKIGFSKP